MKINEKNLVAFSVAPTVVQREGCLLKRGEVSSTYLIALHMEDKEPIVLLLLYVILSKLCSSETLIYN